MASHGPGIAVPENFPEVGRAISITQMDSLAERVAVVTKIASQETWITLTRSTPILFKESDPVRLKHWKAGNTYYWGEQVLKLPGSPTEEMAVSRNLEKVNIERRQSFRVHSQVPLSFSVVHAAQSRLVTENIFNSKTQNISNGGLAFRTDLPLEVGDELQMSLDLISSRPVSTYAWVVRSELDDLGLYSLGLEFLELSRETRNQFQRFLARYEVEEQVLSSLRKERKQLIRRRDSLRSELYLLRTKGASQFLGKVRTIRIEIQEINQEIVRDLDNLSPDRDTEIS